MSTMKLLFCAACLCSAGVFVKSAMTQEKDTVLEPAMDNRTFYEPEKPKTAKGVEQALESHRVHEPRRGVGVGALGMFGDRIASGTPLRPRTVRRTVTETTMEPIPLEELEAMQKLQAAMQQLKTGKDDAARKAATETIQQQLTTQFEADLKQREKELAEVEQRVKSLREQLDKRKAAQADIINLRLQTLINDANGLGFPETGFTSGEPTSVRALAFPPAVQTYEPGSPEPRARRPSDELKDDDVFDR